MVTCVLRIRPDHPAPRWASVLVTVAGARGTIYNVPVAWTHNYIRRRARVAFHFLSYRPRIQKFDDHCVCARQCGAWRTIQPRSQPDSLPFLSTKIIYKFSTHRVRFRYLPLLHDVLLKVIARAGGVARRQCRQRFVAASPINHQRNYWFGPLT